MLIFMAVINILRLAADFLSRAIWQKTDGLAKGIF